MADSKRYDVCVPRIYKDARGAEKTHFWKVGTAFPLRERDGFSVQLYTRVLPSDRLVLFVYEPNETGETTAPEERDNDPPF